MQFIGSGDRILTENFNIGYLYTITFTNGVYINSACIGKGDNFVMFQRTEPDLIFNLNVESADEVSTIELYDSGGGTNDYDDLSNKPQINSITLSGNKSSSDLGLQDTISDLSTIRSGAAAGATAVQPATLSDYQSKIDSDNMLSSDLVDDSGATHKFATQSQLDQIGINENNILITDITANFIAATGYTIQPGISSVYKQGKHVFGTLSVKIDSGNLPTISTTIATNNTDKPNSATLIPCGCGADEWQIDSIGTCYYSQYSGEIKCSDTVSTNTCFNLQLDYLTF